MEENKKTTQEDCCEAEEAKEECPAAEAPGETTPIGDDTASAENAAAEDVDALQGELEQAKDRLLRTLAEFDNYRKRIARDMERVRKTAAESLMGDLLPVLDNLERALAHRDDESNGFSEGVEMVFKQLSETLSRHGLTPIPAQGQPFDPNIHEAMMRMDAPEVPEGHVAQEIQRGYRLGDYVLRPARVAVSMGAPQAEEAGEQAAPDNAAGTEQSRTAETEAEV